MNEEEILDIFRETGAILDGHFILSSGLHSPTYLQCAMVLQYPRQAELLCKALADKFRDEKPDTVIAPALGGLVVSYEVARALGARSLFTERREGTMELRRGFSIERSNNVLVVEDVITTGISVKEVVDIVKSSGAKCIGVGSIVDRSKKDINSGAPFKSLIKLTVPTFQPKHCPLCEQGMPLVKPGSRK